MWPSVKLVWRQRRSWEPQELPQYSHGSRAFILRAFVGRIQKGRSRNKSGPPERGSLWVVLIWWLGMMVMEAADLCFSLHRDETDGGRAGEPVPVVRERLDRFRKKASASCIRLRTTRPTSRPKISDQTRNELRAAKIPAAKVLRSLREFTEDLFSLLGRWRYGANDFYENPAVRDLESAGGGIRLLDDATEISLEFCEPLLVGE